ncbi:MAG: hypothetical protein V9H25_10975 [Candidatus Competibacter sp.]
MTVFADQQQILETVLARLDLQRGTVSVGGDDPILVVVFGPLWLESGGEGRQRVGDFEIARQKRDIGESLLEKTLDLGARSFQNIFDVFQSRGSNLALHVNERAHILARLVKHVLNLLFLEFADAFQLLKSLPRERIGGGGQCDKADGRGWQYADQQKSDGQFDSQTPVS